MSEQRIPSLDEQGRRLSAAFATAEPVNRSARMVRRLAIPSLVAIALVAALLAGVGRDGDSVLSLDAAVAGMAKAAFDRPALPNDRYLYMNTLTTSSGGAGGRLKNGKHLWVHLNTTMGQESWAKLGAPILRRLTQYPQKTVSPEDEKNLRLLGGKMFPKHTFSCVSRSTRPATEVEIQPMSSAEGIRFSDIPEDPKGAYDLMYKRAVEVGSDDPAGQVWASLSLGMMGAGIQLSAEQRAALAGAMSYVPGVTVLPTDRDPNGNLAVGFTRRGNGLDSVVYFDRDTSFTTYVKDTVVDPEHVNDGRTRLPVGATFWSYELKAYEFVDAPPKFDDVKVTDAAVPIFCAPPSE